MSVRKQARQIADEVVIINSTKDIPFPVGSLAYRVVLAKLRYTNWASINNAGVKMFFQLAKGVRV